jgi:hypothetical protein
LLLPFKEQRSSSETNHSKRHSQTDDIPPFELDQPQQSTAILHDTSMMFGNEPTIYYQETNPALTAMMYHENETSVFSGLAALPWLDDMGLQPQAVRDQGELLTGFTISTSFGELDCLMISDRIGLV